LRSGKWTSKGQYTETYETYFGKAEVKRYVYQSSKGGKTYCPLEEKAQLIEAATPKFAKTLSSKYAHLGVGQVTADLLDNHGRSISATYVQRVSDAVGLLLTTKGERWQYALPDDLDKRTVKALSVGMDGTCVLATPHTFRHSMGVAMVAAGVDITVIRSLLGHVSLDTTNHYARANLETKRQALEKVDTSTRPSKPPRWKRDPDLLAWLNSL
jgi:Phage integrase family